MFIVEYTELLLVMLSVFHISFWIEAGLMRNL